jgi:DNA polymerase zeta
MYNVPTILFVLLCLMPDNFISRVVDLLQNGAILNKIFQPYESHIPYLLQVCYLLYSV